MSPQTDGFELKARRTRKQVFLEDRIGSEWCHGQNWRGDHHFARIGSRSQRRTPANAYDVTQVHELLHGQKADIFADSGYRSARKRQFRFTKVRYKGLAKNTANLVTLFALFNLCIARKRILQAAGGGLRPRRAQGPTCEANGTRKQALCSKIASHGVISDDPANISVRTRSCVDLP